MAADWKDLLSSMRDSLPQDESPDPQPEKAPEKPLTKKGKIHMSIEKKGRGGKTATILYGFECDDIELASIATQLKQRLGIGGSARGGEILLQGDCREKAQKILEGMGFKL